MRKQSGLELSAGPRWALRSPSRRERDLSLARPAKRVLAAFTGDWEHLVRLQVGEPLVARAAGLAWEHGLRGYDTVHLAAALLWHEALGEPVTVATYDKQLWRGALASGLSPWADGLPLTSSTRAPNGHSGR